MQSANYRDLRETYGSHTLTWKIRKALVEGLSIRYSGQMQDLYEQLINRFSANSPERVKQLRGLFNAPGMQKEKPRLLDNVLGDFHPTYGKWNTDRFAERDIEDLVEVGVVKKSESTDVEGVLDDLTSTERRQVVISDVPLEDPNLDYKRLTHQQVLLLNGQKVIRHFADGKFEVPTPFSRITNAVFRDLQNHNYSFPQALYAALEILSNEVAFAIRRPDGNKTYMFLWHLFEGDELYEETKAFRPKLHDTSLPDLIKHGKIEWGEFKYLGQNQFRVPRRSPTLRKPYNHVTTKYLPHLARPRDMWLEWFNTEMVSDSDFALEFRNREDRTGTQMVRYTQIFDAHSRWVLRLLADNIKSEQTRESMVYPTEKAIAIMDAIRYRLHNKQGNTKYGWNNLLMTAAREYGSGDILQSEPPVLVLKPLYTGVRE